MGLKSKYNKAKNKVNNTASKITTSSKDKLNSAKNKVNKSLLAKRGFASTWNSASDYVSGGVSDATSYLKDGASDITKAALDVAADATSAGKNMLDADWGGIKKEFKEVTNDVIDAGANVASEATDELKDIYNENFNWNLGEKAKDLQDMAEFAFDYGWGDVKDFVHDSIVGDDGPGEIPTTTDKSDVPSKNNLTSPTKSDVTAKKKGRRSLLTGGETANVTSFGLGV